MNYEASLSFAKSLDESDPLSKFRELFLFPKDPKGGDCIYLNGNSLGLQPKSVAAYVQTELEDWASLGVKGHMSATNPWFYYHEFVKEDHAALVGAHANEAVAMNSLTVNLHLMMVSFYRPTQERHKILIESGAFPSDEYAVRSQIAYHGFDPDQSLIKIAPKEGQCAVQESELLSLIEENGQSIALVLLGVPNYLTGQALPIADFTRTAQKQGCVVGLDLAHGVGNLKLKLHDDNVDFAVWCNYKYVNSGPGAPGGCFVHDRHTKDKTLPRFAGWWGHEQRIRFQMSPHFQPSEGADGWQLSNPPILAMAPLRASLEIFSQATMDALIEKQHTLTGFLEFLLERSGKSFQILTPKSPSARGAQLSLKVPKVSEVLRKQLLEEGVICDVREPNIVRVAPTPLYNTYSDVFRFVEVLETTNL